MRASDTWALTAAALGLPHWVLRMLPRWMLHRLLMLLKGHRERRWLALEQQTDALDRERRRASLDLDIVIAAIDALAEGRLP